MGMIISGKQIISRLKEDIKEQLSSYNGVPHISIILNMEDEPSKSYVKSIQKTAEKNGFNISLYKVDNNTTEDELIEIIDALSTDNNIDGIIVTRPYVTRMKKDIINRIHKWKDIDGQTDWNMISLYKNEDGLYPATPLAVMEFFREVNYKLRGKHAVIVGRSKTVGLPLFFMLLREDATLTVCHSKTDNIKKYTEKADVVISAAGVPHLITKDMVENASFLVDVGINVVDGKIVGDMDIDYEEFEKDEKDLKFITPVPGGVGPVTTYMLLLNTLYGMKQRGKI